MSCPLRQDASIHIESTLRQQLLSFGILYSTGTCTKFGRLFSCGNSSICREFFSFRLPMQHATNAMQSFIFGGTEVAKHVRIGASFLAGTCLPLGGNPNLAACYPISCIAAICQCTLSISQRRGSSSERFRCYIEAICS